MVRLPFITPPLKTTADMLSSNEVDLRILREMGVEIDRQKYIKPLQPVQRFRAGVFAVIAAIRMSNMEERWRAARDMGEELKAMRKRQVRQASVPRLRST